MSEQRTLRDVVKTITSGDFYKDFDQSSADLALLWEAVERFEQRVTYEMVETATMKLAGHDKDTAPGVDWRLNREWTISELRQRMREALEAVL